MKTEIPGLFTKIGWNGQPTKVNPYLVQRIFRIESDATEPIGNMVGYYTDSSKQNNVKLTDAERTTFGKFFSLDYMGSAEYEFGAVYKALNAMSKLDLVVTSFKIKGKPDTFCYVNPETYKKLTTEVETEVFVLSRSEDADAVKTYMEIMANDEYSITHKESTYIKRGLFGQVEHPQYKGTRRLNENKLVSRSGYGDIGAWLDLDNHWMASTSDTQIKFILKMLGK